MLRRFKYTRVRYSAIQSLDEVSMNIRYLLHTIPLIFVLGVVAACGTAPTTGVPTALPGPQSQDAWIQARASLPTSVMLYKPTYMPERFGKPELLEAHSDQADGPVYTIVYSTSDETLAFILNAGKGALGNFPPPERREVVTVLGWSGELESSTETHALGVFWQTSMGNYQIKVYSKKMTTEELKQIIESLH